MNKLKNVRPLLLVLGIMLINIAAPACSPKENAAPRVMQLDTYMIYAREDGKAVSDPILPGEFSIKLVEEIFPTLEKIYDNLRSTYGYTDLVLAGQDRSFFLADQKENKLDFTLDTLQCVLRLHTQNGQTGMTLRLFRFRDPQNPVFKSRLTFEGTKTIVLGLGQAATPKRSAMFLVMQPATVPVNNARELSALQNKVLGDLKHQSDFYMLAKQIRQQLHLQEDKASPFYPFQDVQQLDKFPKPIKRVQPDFPETAYKEKREGMTVLRILLDENGVPLKTEVVKSAGSDLDQAAQEAALKMRFAAPQYKGRPCKTLITVPYVFRLVDKVKINKTIKTDKPVPFMELTRKPKIVHYSVPQYPESARKKAIEGTVLVLVTINREGRVEQARVTKSVDPALDKAALAAARQCEFSPPYLNGHKVKATMNIPFKFKLK